MGNRGGCFHDAAMQLIGRHWVSHRWIICRLDYERSGPASVAGKYTKLFFLDEATALSSGHRPCFRCRRGAAKRFFDLWPHAGATLEELDRRLHEERLGPKPVKPVSSLPSGAIVEHAGSAWLVENATVRRWTFAGYEAAVPAPREAILLTPESTVEVLRRGYLL